MTPRMPTMVAASIVGCLLATASALADGHVTLCQTDTQAGPGINLATAVALGGRITFACGAGASIRMTTRHQLRPGTVVDGGGVTLDAHGAPLTMFYVAQGDVTLRRLTLRDAKRNTSRFRERDATVLETPRGGTLEDVTVEASTSPIRIGGAATIIRSRFLGNSGWAADVSEANVQDSSFIGNETGLNLKVGTVRKSVFVENRGAGVRVSYPLGTVRILASTFERNTGDGAVVLSQRAGQRSVGVIEIRRSVFRQNVSSTDGGAVSIRDTTLAYSHPANIVEALRRLPPARFVLAYNQYIGNRAQGGGAIHADLTNTGGLTIQGGIFQQNAATGMGGAIAWTSGPVLVTHSIFRGNSSGSGGAALHGRDATVGPTSGVANTLVVENVAVGRNGAVDVNSARLFNVTIAKNVGVGLTATASVAPTISNSILSENSRGNCRDVDAMSFRGPSLQFGAVDCPGVPSQDPELDSFYAPSHSSPALVGGQVEICRNAPVSRVDIVFQSRRKPKTCALGAFERPPMRRLSRQGER